MTARRALPVGAVWLLLSLAGWGTVAAIRNRLVSHG